MVDISFKKNHFNNKKDFSLRVVNPVDVELVSTWLNQTYIKSWYIHTDEWLDEIFYHKSDFLWINHFIFEYKNIPIGFCQYYECAASGLGYLWDNEPRGTFGIDYFIGDKAYLNKGIGTLLVEILCNKIMESENVQRIIADTSKQNHPSCRILEKNGFVYFEDINLYRKNIY